MRRGNEYQQAIPPALYERLTKSVLAAIVVSWALRLGPDGEPWEAVPDTIVEEWRVLHESGVVPQAPPRAKGGAL